MLQEDTPLNVIDQVLIKPEIRCAWIDALADISRTVMFKKGFYGSALEIDEETAHVTNQGVLTLTTTVEGTKVEMNIPPGMWEWGTKRPM